jgi:hypothetical protein
MLPFGVGQFQNGQLELGYVLLVTQTLAAGTGIVSAVVHQSLIDDGAAQGKHLDADGTNPRLHTAYLVNVYSAVALAALAVGGIIHAQATFVDETTEVRKRPVPAEPSLTPSVAVSGSGAFLGFTGRF